MTIKFRLLFLFAIFISGINIYGQVAPASTDGVISGIIVDKQSGSPLQYATISLYTSDSALVTGTITLADGSFSLTAGPGNYYAVIQFISYQNKIIENIAIGGQTKKVNLGNLELEIESKNLGEVTVVGERSEMTVNLDKKVFNIGKDLSNTGKTALDILDNIPSVTVDMNGNIALRGSGNIQILIDGKPSGLVNSENTNALQTIQGSMIERIEVITNPSARYEAEGMAGIINIVLKKDARKGLNGTFETTIGYPQQLSLGTNINFRKNKFNYFLNYSLRYSERPGSGNSYQRFSLPDTSYITRIERERLRSGISNRIRGGLDYNINAKNSLTGSLLYGFDIQQNNTDVLYRDFSINDNLLATTLRVDHEQETERDIEASLNYEKRFTKKDQKFTVIAQYMKNSEKEESDIEEGTLPPVDSLSVFQRLINDESESNLLIQSDFVYPFGNEGKFETGYRSEYRYIRNPYNVEELNENTWVNLPQYSNNFEYRQNIHAAYLQGGNKFGRISLQAGLRAELSDVRTNLHETNEKDEKLYLDFFPTFHGSYQFGKIHALQLSYSRRIQRPRFWLLNPFTSFSDSRNIRTGNPNLKPEYTHSLETGYLANSELFNVYSGVYYRNTANAIERISRVDSLSGITTFMPLNLSERNSFGVEGNLTFRFRKWLSLSGNVNFYRFISHGNYQGKSLDADDYSWNTRFNSRIRLPQKVDFQAIFFYRAPEKSAEGMRKAFYMLNLGISKDVMKGNGTLTFNVQDALNSRKFRFITDQPQLWSENEMRWSKPSFTLSFIYRLNQSKKITRSGRENSGEDFGGEELGF